MTEKIAINDYNDNPKQLLIDTAKENREQGSSTFVIASIGKDNKLNISFIGDSCKIG